MPETAKRTARVPILGEDGRISDDYIPAAIGEGVESAEAAATRAETAATSAEDSASAASQSAAQASGSASAASASAAQAQQSATTAGGAATSAQSAQTAAEAAKTAAEAAQSAAAGSASQAQQSATAAAQSAASVADKYISSAQATTLEPGSQATASVENQVLTIGVPKGDKGDKGDTGEKGDPGVGVPDGGTPGQLLSKTEDGTAWVDPPSGNVLKGTLGPAHVLSADDAYATKPRRLTVYGNTRQNLWSNPSGTSNGVTVTSNGDGSMTLSGTATSAASVSSADSYIIKPSTAYTLSMNAALTGASFVVTEYDADGSQLAQHNASSTSAASFTSSASVARCVMSLSVQSGQAVSGTYRVMLNEGGTAEPWCPPGLNSVEELSLVTAGKNLLVSEKSTTRHGITYTVNEDGTVDMNGTASYLTGFYYPSSSWGNCLLLPKGTYTFSASGVISKTSAHISLKHNLEDESSFLHEVISEDSDSATFTIDDDCLCIAQFNVEAGITVDLTFSLQLEFGSTATEYEPPNVNTVPINLSSNALRSLPDGTCDVLHVDGTGAVSIENECILEVFDGSENWGSVQNEQYGEYYAIKDIGNYTSQRSALCDSLPVSNPYSTSGSCAYVFGVQSGRAEIRMRVAGVEGVEALKSWLAANPVKILYERQEKKEVDLPGIAMPTLPGPTANVWAVATDGHGNTLTLQPEIELEYARDVTLVIGSLEAKVAALELLHETE